MRVRKRNLSNAIYRTMLHDARRLADGDMLESLKRRTGVVGIFPYRSSVIRLVGLILAEQDNEWQDGRCYFWLETMSAIDVLIPIEEVGQRPMLAS